MQQYIHCSWVYITAPQCHYTVQCDFIFPLWEFCVQSLWWSKTSSLVGALLIILRYIPVRECRSFGGRVNSVYGIYLNVPCAQAEALVTNKQTMLNVFRCSFCRRTRPWRWSGGTSCGPASSTCVSSRRCRRGRSSSSSRRSVFTNWRNVDTTILRGGERIIKSKR